MKLPYNAKMDNINVKIVQPNFYNLLYNSHYNIYKKCIDYNRSHWKNYELVTEKTRLPNGKFMYEYMTHPFVKYYEKKGIRYRKFIKDYLMFQYSRFITQPTCIIDLDVTLNYISNGEKGDGIFKHKVYAHDCSAMYIMFIVEPYLDFANIEYFNECPEKYIYDWNFYGNYLENIGNTKVIASYNNVEMHT